MRIDGVIQQRVNISNVPIFEEESLISLVWLCISMHDVMCVKGQTWWQETS